FIQLLDKLKMSANAKELRLQDELFNERARFLKEFLEANDRDYEIKYKSEILRLLRAGEKRLIVSLNDIRHYHNENSEKIIDSPNEWILALEKAIKDVALSLNDPIINKIEDLHVHAGFTGNFRYHVNPGTLKSIHLGKLICVEGIVSR
ncbi:26105_t:CDS:2, partial [Gigaspora rosea]